MEALRASYGAFSDSDDDGDSAGAGVGGGGSEQRSDDGGGVAPALPPPPIHLLDSLVGSEEKVRDRVRSFPHVKGNYALHVYIPVVIPFAIRKELIPVIKRLSSLVPGLHVVDADIPLSDLCRDDQRLEQVVLGREFHISLGRTVPVRVHQIDSIVLMLRQKLQSQKGYWIGFDKWEVFVNDDQTRTFLSLEVTGGGLMEITRQIHIVDNIYRLHNLPEFYENPRPHISLVWALGDISHSLRRAVEEHSKYRGSTGQSQQLIFGCKFGGIECKIGKVLHEICKASYQ